MNKEIISVLIPSIRSKSQNKDVQHHYVCDYCVLIPSIRSKSQNRAIHARIQAYHARS